MARHHVLRERHELHTAAASSRAASKSSGRPSCCPAGGTDRQRGARAELAPRVGPAKAGDQPGLNDTGISESMFLDILECGLFSYSNLFRTESRDLLVL